ncbi:MAG: 16S rRNA (uracil(1498)-N(3))-methyltransferase [Burkholderiaceae bacterium]|nr:MAG: 16S rRNA (uracil(1498)-N(3))-methyltransferase [Burkholderiaceae bacterium]TAM05476.1 MAG: 16S rRNA (uracil(1498)-N(3))-methyltransferase [Pusillimonas sp.]
MAIPRFFCPIPLGPNQTLELPQELAHHALRVLRLKPESDILLFDGRGGQYPAKLVVERKQGYARIGAHQPTEVELPGEVTLVQGLPSGDKMDWIIEKAVELGASRLIPIVAQRSVLQLSGERATRRMVRWTHIAQSASEQCGRNRIMALSAPRSLQSYLADANLAGQLALLCHPEAAHTLAQAVAKSGDQIVLMVGPEGGWSDEEQAMAARKGVIPVKFGDRVLRTETAGLALIAAITALKHWV